MAYSVILTHSAAADLQSIYDYIAEHDSEDKANYVLDRIESAFAALSDSPQRGVYPKELSAIGIREYREVFFKPYRIIYRIDKKIVYVLLIADGRRDLQTLLQRRLLS